MHLTLEGRYEEAIEEASRAIELDPFSVTARASLGWRYYMARRYEESLRFAQQAILLDPSCAIFHLQSGASLVGLNRCNDAMPELRRYHALADDSSSLTALAYGLARVGQQGQALSMLGELIELRERSYVGADRIAVVYLALGNRSKCLDWLELLAEEPAPSRVELPVHPVWDPVREEARFRALVERLGLPTHDCRLRGEWPGSPKQEGPPASA